jgi:cell division septum initiation protein DivIVA
MKTMKRERAKGREAIRSATSRIRSETAAFLSGVGSLLADIGKANADSGAETREMLAGTQSDLKVMASETAAEASRLTKAIRKSVADLKAEAHQITADADRFMADSSAANDQLRTRTRRALSPLRAERKAQWRQGSAGTQRLVAGIRKEVAALKAETGQIIAEASAMLGRFTSTSQRRAAEWKEIVRGLQDGGHPVTVSSGRTSAPAGAAAVTAGAAKGHCEKASRHGGGRRARKA